jgi:hypothetical protein
MGNNTTKSLTVGIMTGRIITELGPEGLWNSFFELLDRHFTDARKRLPVIRKKLHKGKVKPGDAAKAEKEMALVKERFKEVEIPAGGSLYESLVTVTGRNIVDELIDSFLFSRESGCDVKIVTYGSVVDTAFL